MGNSISNNQSNNTGNSGQQLNNNISINNNGALTTRIDLSKTIQDPYNFI